MGGLWVASKPVLGADLPDPLPVAHGGTGATTAEGALANLGAMAADDIDGGTP
jgi:hypothetical protein